MTKFKVGDRVRTKRDCDDRDDGTPRPKGYMFTIAEIVFRAELGFNIYRETYGVVDGLQASSLELATKSWQTLEAGDIIVDRNGDEAKVLAVLGDVFLKSSWGDFEEAGNWFTKKEAEIRGFKIKGADQDTVKMTVSEVSKLVGKKVEIIEE